MNLTDLIVIAVVVVILAAIVIYIHSAKKKSIGCIGCPERVKCAGNCAGCAGQCGQK